MEYINKQKLSYSDTASQKEINNYLFSFGVKWGNDFVELLLIRQPVTKPFLFCHTFGVQTFTCSAF